MSEPQARLFYGALVIILVFATLDVVNDHDYSLAAENMMIAAHEWGVRCCWIGVAMGIGEAEGILKEAGLSEGLVKM